MPNREAGFCRDPKADTGPLHPIGHQDARHALQGPLNSTLGQTSAGYHERLPVCPPVRLGLRRHVLLAYPLRGPMTGPMVIRSAGSSGPAAAFMPGWRRHMTSNADPPPICIRGDSIIPANPRSLNHSLPAHLPVRAPRRTRGSGLLNRADHTRS